MIAILAGACDAAAPDEVCGTITARRYIQGASLNGISTRGTPGNGVATNNSVANGINISGPGIQGIELNGVRKARHSAASTSRRPRPVWSWAAGASF